MKSRPSAEPIPASSGPAGAIVTPFSTAHAQLPSIPDHELLQRIGRGSYGEVWLARSKLGTMRAVKVVHREAFEDARPFEREFKGIQKFEPISRSHEGLVDILQVGGTEEYFYYVMELADDVAAGVPPAVEGGVSPPGQRAKNSNTSPQSTAFPPGETPGSTAGEDARRYVPRTLRSDLKRHGRLPVAECVRLGLSLAPALAYLHQHRLVHRDIKPSNIIFVSGVPKLADIGLVADLGEARSFVGTEGFIPPEGPGTPQADLYSLGKVLYEMSTGKDRHDFPELPEDLLRGTARAPTPGAAGEVSAKDNSISGRGEGEPSFHFNSAAEAGALIELNAVLVKACATDPRQRYQSAEELHADLALLQRGQSVQRRRAMQRRFAFGRNATATAMLLTLVLVGSYFLIVRMNPRRANMVPLQLAEPTATEGTTNLQAYKKYVQGRSAFNQLTPEGKKQAIQYLTEAIQLDPKFLRAYEKLFDAYVNSSDAEADAKAREIADTLEVLDADSEESHLARGWIKYKDWEFVEAEKHFKLAISANPSRPLPHGMYGCFLVEQGRVAEARIQLQLCDDLDPAFPIVKLLLSRAFFFERNYAEAIAASQYALSVAQNYSRAYLEIAQAQEAGREILAAIDAWQQARTIDGADREQVKEQCDDLRQAFRERGERGYWLKRLAQAQTKPEPEEDPYEMATLYARLGEKEKALDWLNKAYVARDWRMRRLLLDQCWDGLRDEPRFLMLLKNVGFSR